jgi:hypothetical protein
MTESLAPRRTLKSRRITVSATVGDTGNRHLCSKQVDAGDQSGSRILKEYILQ